MPGQFSSWGGYPVKNFRKNQPATVVGRPATATPLQMIESIQRDEEGTAMGVEQDAANQLDMQQHSVCQFEIADKNKMTEKKMGKQRFGVRKPTSDIYKDHMWEELAQYGPKRALEKTGE